MKAMRLEIALRKIAKSGSPDLVYGQANALEQVLKDPSSLDELTNLLENVISTYERKSGKKLDL